MREGELFKSRSWRASSGFYLTMLCASFGLIHLWRFPYIVIQNGGGAFLYLYFLIAAIIGCCFVMAEFMIGKLSQKSLWSAFNRWSKDLIILRTHTTFAKKVIYSVVCRLSEASMMVNLLVVAYFAVISSWILGFITNFFLQYTLPELAMVKGDATEESFLLQYCFALFHLLLCILCVRRRWQRPLEIVGYGVSVIFLSALFYICQQSLTLPNATEALRFLLYPDFTKITVYSVSQAIGHMVLSLGLGTGTLIYLGGYFAPRRDITSAGTRLVLLSIFMSVLSVLILCPMVLGAPYAVFGPKLLFQTIPQFVVQFPYGKTVNILFYGSLYFVSLVGTTGLLENLAANISDRLRWPFVGAIRASLVALIFLVMIPLLSTTVFKNFRWLGGVSLLESLDSILVNLCLPVLALSVAVGATLLIPKKFITNEFDGTDINQELSHFYPIWKVVIWWVAPGLLFLGFVLRLL